MASINVPALNYNPVGPNSSKFAAQLSLVGNNVYTINLQNSILRDDKPVQMNYCCIDNLLKGDVVTIQLGNYSFSVPGFVRETFELPSQLTNMLVTVPTGPITVTISETRLAADQSNSLLSQQTAFSQSDPTCLALVDQTFLAVSPAYEAAINIAFSLLANKFYYAEFNLFFSVAGSVGSHALHQFTFPAGMTMMCQGLAVNGAGTMFQQQLSASAQIWDLNGVAGGNNFVVKHSIEIVTGVNPGTLQLLSTQLANNLITLKAGSSGFIKLLS